MAELAPHGRRGSGRRAWAGHLDHGLPGDCRRGVLHNPRPYGRGSSQPRDASAVRNIRRALFSAKFQTYTIFGIRSGTASIECEGSRPRRRRSNVMAGRGDDSLLPGFARPTLGGETLDGLAAHEVLLDDLGDVALVEAEVPGALRVRLIVDDDVGAVLAQAEATSRVRAHIAEQTRRPQLALERVARLLRAALFAIAAGTHQDVRPVVANLRRRARRGRGPAVRLPQSSQSLLRLLPSGDGPASVSYADPNGLTELGENRSQ
jgi:hypothetical protein